MYQDYSVLMSVYVKEKPEYLRQAIQSMMDQTVPTNDFVLVCDGPLTPELDTIINDYEHKYPEQFHTLRLEMNQGLGNALRKGMLACKNDLVARMDSDDISLPNRCELQLKQFAKNPHLSLCSGHIAEFNEDIHVIQSIRQVPTTHEAILKFAQKRNPMNHVAVMCRKQAVLEAGNYVEMSLAEDYYLWARMFQKGFKAANINEILVYVRIGNGMYDRRGGLSYAKKICTLQKKFLNLSFINYFQFINNCAMRILCSLFPGSIRKVLYQIILRGHK